MTKPFDPMTDALREALDEETRAVAGDDALLARAIDRAMAITTVAASREEQASTSRETTSPPSRVATLRPRTQHRAVRVLLPLAAAFAASVAAAAIYVATRTPAPAPSPVDIPKTTPAQLDVPPAPTANVAPRAEESASISIDELPSVAAPPSASVRPASPPSKEISASAAELFREANQKRASGDVTRAVELYRALIANHPGAPESHAARVSLGRLLLDRKGDPRSALVELDAYLSEPGDRTLAEEARIGRALAFQRLGDGIHEREAWNELLAHHPQSLYGEKARARLDALASP
ncbi:MAG: hypothetical protein KF819_32460 [Labilithrix sp.]|nr:hypothetical protein [Labilithrix sp.]